jgi:hypothetical protein
VNTRSRRVLAAALAALAPVGLLATWLLLRGDLPDPLPTHWDLHGRVDDTLATTTLLVVTLVPSVVLAALAVWLVRRPALHHGDRAFAVGLVWAAWLATTVFATSAVLAAGAAEAADVGMTWWALLAVPLVPTAVAAATHAVLPAARPSVVAGTAPYDGSLRLGDTERVAWVGSASSRGLLVLAAVLELAAVVLVFTVWPVANLLALVGVAVFWVHAVTVRVDDRGLSAAWGPARWPRVRVDLDDVAAVTAEEVEPLAWGGWGYRATPTRTGVVVRRGPGVVVERRSGRRFAVTVDDADGAAEVLGALVERRRRTAGA